MTDHALEPSQSPDPVDEPFVPMSQAAEETGVTLSTINKWVKKDPPVIEARKETFPSGERWTVRVSDVERVATERNVRRTPQAKTSPSNEVEKPAQDQVTAGELVPVMDRIMDLANSIGAAGHAAGMAEAKAEQYKERLNETKAQLATEQEKTAELADENMELKARLLRAGLSDEEIPGVVLPVAAIQQESQPKGWMEKLGLR